MKLQHLLTAGVVTLLVATPAFAQRGGGGSGRPGGGGGGRTGGGAPSGAYHPPGGGGYSGGYRPGYSGGYSGGNHSGIVIGLGVGGFGYGGYGGYGYGGGYGGYGGYGNYAGGGYGAYTPLPYYSGNVVPSVQYGTPVPYSYTPTVVPAPAVVYPDAATTAPATPAVTAGTETGLRITDLEGATAKAAGLRKGDIILSVDGKRTQTFDELRAVLMAAKSSVKVEFIDAATGEVDTRAVTVKDTKIGVTVDETPVKKN